MRNPFRSGLLALIAVLLLGVASVASPKPAHADVAVYLFQMMDGLEPLPQAIRVDTFVTDTPPTVSDITSDNPQAQVWVAVDTDTGEVVGNGIVFDEHGDPRIENKTKGGGEPGIVYHEQRCSGEEKYPKLNLDLMLGAASRAPFFQSDQSTGVMGELKLKLTWPSFSCFAEARNAFHDAGYLDNKSRLKVICNIPLGSGISLFLEGERAWHTGDEWGWVGVKCDLPRLFRS